MKQSSCNCIVCAKEFSPEETNSIVMSKINYTQFKICEACINMSDPADDYAEAYSIVNSYLNVCLAKQCFAEAKILIDLLNED